MVLRRIVRVFGAAVVGVGLVSGCASQPPENGSVPTMRTVQPTPVQPTPVDSATVEPVPFVTPTAAPVMPAAAEELTPEGAEAFVRYWFETINWTQVSNDDELLSQVSATSCEICAAVWDDASVRRAEGSVLSGAIVRLHSVRAETPLGPEVARVRVRFDQEAGAVVGPDGNRSLQPETKIGDRVVVLTRDGEGWMVAGMGVP